MSRVRFFFFLIFAAAVSLGAQQPKSAPTAAPAHRSAAIPASYRISISFRRNFHGRPRTDKTYSLLATVGETLPAIRDDTRFRTDAKCAEAACTIEGATDVDILSLKPHGTYIMAGLKISMQTIGTDTPEFLPKLPAAGTHQYLVTPTIPIGKRITVYSATDASYNSTVEVQLLIEPFDPAKPIVQP